MVRGEDDTERVAALGRALAAEGLLQEVAGPDEELWSALDLASAIEIRLDTMVTSGEATRDRDAWNAKLGECFGAIHRDHATPYWIMQHGKRVGTVALGCGLSPGDVHLTSLYVLPQHRGTKVASRALQAIGFGLRGAELRRVRLETEWSAFRAIPLYLALGMRVRMWKRDLAFTWAPSEPRWSMTVDDAIARCIVEGRELFVARRDATRLVWTATAGELDFDDRRELEGTFAVALAARGFPLLTSVEEWAAAKARGASDCGGVVELALRIEQWEAWARHQGWHVRWPRVPGLTYPRGNELTRVAV